MRTTKKIVACLRTLTLWAALPAVVSASPILQSDFESGVPGGWTISGIGSAVTVVNADGPVGPNFLQTEDTGNGYLYFAAPASWSGDYYGGHLSFFLRNQNPNNYRAAGWMGDGVVKITGGGLTLYYWGAPGANTNWTFNDVFLGSDSHWSLSVAVADSYPTDEQIETVFRNIDGIYILADWVNGYYGKPGIDYGHDITQLDGVVLFGVPEPSTLCLVGLGLLSAVFFRRHWKF